MQCRLKMTIEMCQCAPYFFPIPVSFGGIINLFLGLSLLSSVEVVYYLIFRLPATLWRQRALGNGNARTSGVDPTMGVFCTSERCPVETDGTVRKRYKQRLVLPGPMKRGGDTHRTLISLCPEVQNWKREALVRVFTIETQFPGLGLVGVRGGFTKERDCVEIPSLTSQRGFTLIGVGAASPTRQSRHVTRARH
uniref:Uncharacterized protein n=1 Tax=Timema cristinae TaxID=61476 RepID=A0A7R9CBF0_TIMCR|nr:unnamed protein product [Timema cristinae]